MADLRTLFIETLTYVCQGCGGVPPVKFAHSLTLKEKVSTLKFREKTSEEVTSYKYLLVHIVRLMSTDPMLFLHNASKQNTEMLINGINSLSGRSAFSDWKTHLSELDFNRNQILGPLEKKIYQNPTLLMPQSLKKIRRKIFFFEKNFPRK